MYMNIHVLQFWCAYLKHHLPSNNLALGKPANTRTPAESINASKLILTSLKFCSWVRTMHVSKGRETGLPPSLMQCASGCQDPSEQSIIFLAWDSTGWNGAGSSTGVLPCWLTSFVFGQYLSSWLKMGQNHYKQFPIIKYQWKCFYYLTSSILSLFSYLIEITQLSNHYSETSDDSGSNLEKKRKLFTVCQLWSNVDF